MAAVDLELLSSWISFSGLLLLLFILLSIILTALCSDCGRRTFDLKDSQTEKSPSALISVVELEEARENPMISQICSDEKAFQADVGHQVQETLSSVQQGAPQTNTESSSEEDQEVPVPFIPWKNHLVEPLSSDVNAPPGSSHIHIEKTPPTSPDHTPESVKTMRGEPSPPPPHRRAEMDG